jgi:hypothetical protein
MIKTHARSADRTTAPSARRKNFNLCRGRHSRHLDYSQTMPLEQMRAFHGTRRRSRPRLPVVYDFTCHAARCFLLPSLR